MKTKKSMVTGTKVLIGLVLFCLFVVVLFGAYVDMANEYGVTRTTDSQESFNKIEQITANVTYIGKQFQTGTFNDANVLVIGAKSIWAAGQILLNTLTLPITLVNQFSHDLTEVYNIPIPPIFISVLITLITIGFIYMVGSLFA